MPEEKKERGEPAVDDSRENANPDGSRNPGGESAVPPPNAGAEASGAGVDAEARAASLEREVSELKDQYLRKLADYENFRKRMFREKEEAILYANTSLLVDLVQVLDDFDRAVRSAETANDFKMLHDGVLLIERQLFGLLESKYGLKRFESVGTPFDPSRHEAIAVEKSDDSSCVGDTVVEEYLKGYALGERVIRSAKVKVRQPADPAAYARADAANMDGKDGQA